MATRTATITVSIPEPSASEPTVSSITVEYDDSQDANGTCDLIYLAEGSEGGPVMRPANPRF